MSERPAETTHSTVEGIDQAAEPCWYAETPDGHAFEYGDGSPHWESEAKAREQLAEMVSPDQWGRPEDLTLRRESEGCWYLTCGECGYRFDEDEWIMHMPSRRDVLTTADDCDWHIVDGRALCSECAIPPVTDGGESRG